MGKITGRLIQLHINDGVTLRGDLSIKHTRNGKVRTLLKTGQELHRDTNTWQHRERRINKAHPHDEHSYTERIENPELGIVIQKDEKLADHRNRKKDTK